MNNQGNEAIVNEIFSGDGKDLKKRLIELMNAQSAAHAEELKKLETLSEGRRKLLVSTAERITALEKELADWSKWNIVEIASRNPQVLEYCQHWEGRAEKAEASSSRLRAALENIAGPYKCVLSPTGCHVHDHQFVCIAQEALSDGAK